MMQYSPASRARSLAQQGDNVISAVVCWSRAATDNCRVASRVRRAGWQLHCCADTETEDTRCMEV